MWEKLKAGDDKAPGSDKELKKWTEAVAKATLTEAAKEALNAKKKKEAAKKLEEATKKLAESAEKSAEARAKAKLEAKANPPVDKIEPAA